MRYLGIVVSWSKAFIKSKKLVESLQKKDWETFAYGYNGPKYKENKYDEKMRKAYEAARGKT